MSSTVRHPGLRVRAEPLALSRPSLPQADHEAPPSLLAARAFWIGGAASLGLWTLMAAALTRVF